MSLLTPANSLNKRSAMPDNKQGNQMPTSATGEITPPKCFGTDYFGKWNMTGMTFDSMKIDKPDWQIKCANCALFERCYLANHIRMLRIKR